MMGRKHNRDQRWQGEPLDLTPSEAMRTQPRPVPGMSREEIRRQREARDKRLREQQRTARINNGIDWSVCLVPGCGEELRLWGMNLHRDKNWRDHTVALPLCLDHLAVAYKQAQTRQDDPILIDAAAQVIERRQAKAETLREASKKAWLAKNDGHMYYVRLNGLIKVGWTRDLRDRLRAYGPDVEVLCHYPATRQDETNLHRQLRPFLARGREWYQDCKALHDFIKQAIEQHGEPTVRIMWSQPKEVIRPRKRSA